MPELKLPSEFNQTFGETLTASQLGGNVLTRYGIPELPDQARSSLRDFLYDLNSYDDWIAVPAGIPLVWLEKLPLTGRTRNALRRTFRDHKTATYFSEPLMATEFLRQRQVGVTLLNELMCVIESAEIEDTHGGTIGDYPPSTDTEIEAVADRIFSPFTYDEAEAVGDRILSLFDEDIPPDLDFLPPLQSADDGTLEHGAKILTGTDRDTIRPFIDFAKWAMAETGTTNLGEAVVNAINQSHAPEVWSQLAAVPLIDIASPFPHPYQVITSWADELEPRDKAILATRIASLHRTQTLEELANDFGVTRERIRQVEARVRRKLQGFCKASPRHRSSGEPLAFETSWVWQRQRRRLTTYSRHRKEP